MTTYSQPGIFNVLDYGMVPGPAGVPTANQAALQQAIYFAQAVGGGTILIPSQEEISGVSETVYNIDGPIYVGSPTSLSPVAIIFAGTAQGTQTETTLVVNNSGDLFVVDTGENNVDDEGDSNDEHVGGITFQDLGIRYKTPTSGTAINVLHGENVRVFRVVFVNCPQAVWFQDTLQCSIFQCTIVYNSLAPTPACITLGNDAENVTAIETYIAAGKFISHAQGGPGLVIQGSEHTRVNNIRFEGFSEGIMIVPSTGKNAIKGFFENLSVYSNNPSGPAGSALTIQPQGPAKISQMVFAQCDFAPAEGETSSLGPGIYIDENGSTIDHVRLVSCRSVMWAGPGLEITSGTTIEVLGGFYSGNASGATPSGGLGGISITGPASGIRIVGASCIGSFPNITTSKSSSSNTQDVGIYIAGSGASEVIIDHCDLTGNGQYGVLIGAGGLDVTNIFIRNCNAGGYASYSDAVQVVGEVSNVQITNCAGYNDQAVTLYGPTTPYSGTFHNYSFGYYGPVGFYVWGTGVTHVHINGISTSLTSGEFTLAPGERGTVDYTGTPNFVVFGK